MSPILLLSSLFYITLGGITKVELNSSFSDDVLQIAFVSDLEFDLEETNKETIFSEATKFLAQRTVQQEEFLKKLLQKRELVVVRKFATHNNPVAYFVKAPILLTGVVTLFLILITVYYLLYPCIHHNNGGRGGMKRFLKGYTKRQTLVHQIKKIHGFVHKSDDALYLDPKFVHLQVIKKLEKEFLKPRKDKFQKKNMKWSRKPSATSPKPRPIRIKEQDKNFDVIHGTQPSSVPQTQPSVSKTLESSEQPFVLLPPLPIRTDSTKSTVRKSKDTRRSKKSKKGVRQKKSSIREDITQTSEETIPMKGRTGRVDFPTNIKADGESEKINSTPNSKSPNIG